MSIEDIVESVRLCIDEKVGSSAEVSASDDYTTMDDIIKDKIGDALRWICLYAPAELLGGSDEKQETGGVEVPVETNILKDYTPAAGDITNITIDGTVVGARFNLSSDYIKLARVRVDGWHRAIKTPINEDAEEYLQLYDANGATATYDRPQAAIIDTAVRKMEVWPWKTGETISLTYVSNADPVEITSGRPAVTTGYALPPRAITAFIYYLAFLLLSAYGDGRASTMLDVAKMNLGITK